MEEVLGIRSLDTGIGSAGVGFVVVPEEVDRNQYIKDCYRTNTVTINGGKGYGYFSAVNVDVNVMQNIEFPVDKDNRGTPVVWVKDAISQLPVIVAVLRKQNNYYSLNENQKRIYVGTAERGVEILADGNNSSLQISLVGDSEEYSEFDLKLTSSKKNSVFNLFSDNEINITTEKRLNVISNDEVEAKIKKNGDDKVSIKFNGEGLLYKDENKNEFEIKNGEINIKSDKINHNDGKEPMVLGDTLVNILNDLLSAIEKLTVISPTGETSVPVNVAEFVTIQSKINNIKSKKSNLD